MIKLPKQTSEWVGKTITLEWTGRFDQVCTEKFFVEFEDPYSHYKGTRFEEDEEYSDSELRFSSISEEKITVVLVEDGKRF